LHVDLVTEEPLADEVARLVAAGATFVETRQDPATHANPDRWTVLLDPEGNVFCVTSVATLTGWSTPVRAAAQ
jgi:selenocysteine lyase/cysteine desulfurase